MNLDNVQSYGAKNLKYYGDNTYTNYDNSLKGGESIFVQNQALEGEDLNDKLDEVKNKQGLLGNIWNGFKNLTGLGLSSDDVEEKIKQYENNEISYDEALSSIDEFEQKQDSAVDMVASMASGLVVAGSVAVTGGTSLLASAAIGGAVKAGIKTVDRATNSVQGDELDVNQVGKDLLTGAVDGAVTMGTMKLIPPSAPLAGQSVSRAIVKGAVRGAADGAISGGVMGGTNYVADALFEDDVEFSFDEFAKAVGEGTIAGGVMGGVMGGVTGGVQQYAKNGKVKISRNKNLDQVVDNKAQAEGYLDNYNKNLKEGEKPITGEAYNKAKENLTELSERSEALAREFDSTIEESTRQVDDIFANKKDIETLTSRPKGQSSTNAKLAKKYLGGEDLSTLEKCYDVIGDAQGFRIQMKSLTKDEAAQVVEDIFKDRKISATFDDYIKFVKNDATLDSKVADNISTVYDDVVSSLTKKQTDSVVDQLAKGVKTGKIDIDEINIYGEKSYFTNDHAMAIADAKAEAYSKNLINNNKLKIVSPDIEKSNAFVTKDPKTAEILNIKVTSKNAIKDSGYISAQMNTKQVLSNGKCVNGELQIRGTEVNAFADVEHIPYDIRTGKIYSTETKYSDIYNVIRGMDDVDYNMYNQYLSDTYEALRNRELYGIDFDLPNIADYIKNGSVSSENLSLLDMNGLIQISQRH